MNNIVRFLTSFIRESEMLAKIILCQRRNSNTHFFEPSFLNVAIKEEFWGFGDRDIKLKRLEFPIHT